MKKSKHAYASMSRGEKILGCIWLVLQVFLPWLADLANGLLTDPLGSGSLTFVTYLVNFLVTVCIFHRFLSGSLSAAWHSLWELLQAVILGFVFLFALTKLTDWALLRALDIGAASLVDRSISQLASANVYLRLAGILVLAPVIDETLYRGLIYRNLHQKSAAAAYILSILVFALVHTLGHVGTAGIQTMVLCFLRYLPAGLCLAWTYSKADNIVAPIIVHAAINAITLGII